MKVVITDHGFATIEREQGIINAAGHELVVAQCKTADEVIAAAHDADALLVQWAPVTADVLKSLKNCKIIVRYGIGLDNIDLEAARSLGIAVSNVPEYCINEVADHAAALALALARQLTIVDQRTRSGIWKITPDRAMPAFNQMIFATAGYGRIARAILERARVFGFQCAAYDPYVDASVMEAAGVESLGEDELFARADIISLHLPLKPETHHWVNAERLAQMKSSAILVNTARGGLIDTHALAASLNSGHLNGAGLDVFEEEPLGAEHPLRSCNRALLTSHVAWYSESSVPELQRLAADEIVRGLHGEPLKYQANR
jgi:D-3-phosphoglycerate dehydrogenase